VGSDALDPELCITLCPSIAARKPRCPLMPGRDVGRDGGSERGQRESARDSEGAAGIGACACGGCGRGGGGAAGGGAAKGLPDHHTHTAAGPHRRSDVSESRTIIKNIEFLRRFIGRVQRGCQAMVLMLGSVSFPTRAGGSACGAPGGDEEATRRPGQSGGSHVNLACFWPSHVGACLVCRTESSWSGLGRVKGAVRDGSWIRCATPSWRSGRGGRRACGRRRRPGPNKNSTGTARVRAAVSQRSPVDAPLLCWVGISSGSGHLSLCLPNAENFHRRVTAADRIGTKI
jgi:hypothetical protein